MSWREERIESGRCPSCELLVIGGVTVHEHGCPDRHLFTKRECKECGTMFEPKSVHQEFCCDGCQSDYYGLPREDDDFEDEVHLAGMESVTPGGSRWKD